MEMSRESNRNQTTSFCMAKKRQNRGPAPSQKTPLSTTAPAHAQMDRIVVTEILERESVG